MRAVRPQLRRDALGVRANHTSILRTPEEIPMRVQPTAVFQRVPEGYVGFVDGLPGANTQGTTLEEARANLQEAVQLA